MKNNSAKTNILVKFITSIKLAIIILLYIVITSIITTLIPQGKDIAFYREHFHPFLSWCIISTGFYNFFMSFMFIGPLFLFTINLFGCMLYRFTREVRNKQKKRFGPDIIHVGILLFIAGALSTFFLKQEESFFLAEKEQKLIAGTYLLTLESFETLYYPDGRTKDWISTVSIKENNTTFVSSFPIEVNKSLVFKGYSIHQASFLNRKYIVLEDSSGQIIYLPEGHSMPGTMNELRFKAVEKDEKRGILVVMEQWKNGRFVASYKYPPNSRIGSFRVSNIVTETLSGLQIVYDPGFIPIIISFFIILAGLSLTFIQKMKTNKVNL